MNRLARFSVNYPVTVLMLVLGIVLLGIISFGKLGTDLFPDLNNPKIYIELKAGERPPEEIEKLFVDQIESISMRQKDVVQVSSVCEVGTATITIEYQWNKDMDEAFLDIQKDLNTFSQNSTIDEISITQYDPNASPVMVVALRHNTITNMDELRKVAENYIRNEIVRLDGIADVKLAGKEESEVVVETNRFLLDSYGITAEGIASQIASYNRNVSGGSIVDMGVQYTIKGVSVLTDLEDLRNIIVGFKQAGAASGTSAGQASSIPATTRVPVYLRDVATVTLINKDPENIVTLDGERAIGLSIYKEPKFNTVKAVSNLYETLESLRKALPGYEFVVVQDQGEYIDKSIGEVQKTALIGIILAVFVLFIFLRRIGTTLVVIAAIPISIIATFNLMYFNDLTINIMTLGGLALGAGMLVDNAIVVLENIFRIKEDGATFKEAAIEGAGQVGAAITASTITTIVVFLPIVYLHGASGEMFKDQAWTVAFSLLSSLFVAMLLIPTLVAHLFKDKETGRKPVASVRINWYSNLLGKILDRKGLVIGLALLMLAATGFILPRIGSEFMPKAESPEFTMELRLPEGSTLDLTASTVHNAENVLRSLLGDDLKMIYSQAGESSTSTLSSATNARGQNQASIKVFLTTTSAEQTESAIEVTESWFRNLPDLNVTFKREETAVQTTLGTDESPFIAEVRGKDFAEIERIINEASQLLAGNEYLYNLTTSLDDGTPEVNIVIDRFKTSLYNLSVDNVTSQVRSYLSGAEAGTFEREGEMKDITIKLGDVTVNELENMIITAGTMKLPLSSVARVEKATSPRQVTRRNQSRTGYIYGMVRTGKPFDQIVKDAEETISAITIPSDYKIEITGEELKRKESMSNLTFALILSIVLVYMVLASQFESLIHPFTILLTIPLAGIGTVWTFFLLGRSFNMMAYIGIIMLAGIAVNNSIILVDRINQLRATGVGRRLAIIQAGSQRIRPILMTSITTILALLPLTIGVGESASLRSPMALAVIGGLITSTILSLVVIPCVYWALDVLKEKITGRSTE
ncbi:MAG: efflux RND transporter permease subunit [Bacteroidales bacterium]|nr:efflux RND transporter permease subunit [Bacteroidales bacterium]